MRSSKIGAYLALDAIPASDVLRRSADAKDALKHALTDAEDYELLFTVQKRKVKYFIKAWRRVFRLSCVQIGWTTAQKGRLEGIDSEGRKIKLHEAGFEHFR